MPNRLGGYDNEGHWHSTDDNWRFVDFWHNVWNDLTGKSSTIAQNSAAAANQQQSQAYNTAEADRQLEREQYIQENSAVWQMEGLKKAGLNPALAGGDGSTGSAVAASSGIGSAQASNVSLIQSAANAAVTAGILFKIIKAIS